LLEDRRKTRRREAPHVPLGAHELLRRRHDDLVGDGAGEGEAAHAEAEAEQQRRGPHAHERARVETVERGATAGLVETGHHGGADLATDATEPRTVGAG